MSKTITWKGHNILAIWCKCAAFYGQGNLVVEVSCSPWAAGFHSSIQLQLGRLKLWNQPLNCIQRVLSTIPLPQYPPRTKLSSQNRIITFKCGWFFHAVMSRRRTEQSVHMYTKSHRHKHINNNSAEWPHHAAESSKEVAGEVFVEFSESFQEPLQKAMKVCVCVCVCLLSTGSILHSEIWMTQRSGSGLAASQAFCSVKMNGYILILHCCSIS